MISDEELAARHAITELVLRYADMIDNARFESLAVVFAGDATVKIRDDRAVTGRDNIVAALRRGHEAFNVGKTGLFDRHEMTNILIDFESPHSATVRSYFAVVTPTGPDNWGRYIDRATWVDGEWLLSSRQVYTDGYSQSSRHPARPR